MDLREQATFRKWLHHFSRVVAVCSKECMWAVTAAMGEVAASVWAFVAAMGAVSGAAWDFTSSMWDEQALRGLLQVLGGMHRRNVGC